MMRIVGEVTRPWILAALVAAASGLPSFADMPPGYPLVNDGPATLDEGRSLIENGSYDEAVAQLKAKLEGRGTTVSEKARILHTLGYLLLYAGRVEEAQRSVQDAYEWAVRQRLSADAATFKAELAIQRTLAKAIELRNSGNISGSNSSFEEADVLARVAGSPPYQLRIANIWCINYLGSKEGQPRYLSLSLRALALADSLKYRHEASGAAIKVGTYYAKTSDYPRALGYFLRALNGLEAGRDDGDLIACLNNICVMYSSLGDYPKAKDYLLNAVSRIPKGAAGAFETSLLVNLGNLFGGLGKRLQSEDYRQRGLDCFRSYLGFKEVRRGGGLRLEALAGKAGIYLDQGRVDEARAILFPAFEETRGSMRASLTAGKILSLLGELSLRTGAIPDAQRYFEETRGVSEQTGNPLLKMSAAYGLGRCAEAREDYTQAIASYDLALRIIGEGFSGIVSDVQRAEFIGRSREPFQALIRLYLKLSKMENQSVYECEIFRLSEYLRARSYIEFRDRLAGKSPRPDPASENPEEARLNQERIELLKSLSQKNLGRDRKARMETRIVQIDDTLDAAVFDRYGAEDRAVRPLRPIRLEVLQSRIPDDRTAVLEYLLGESRSILFCIKKDSFDLIELPPAQEIDDALSGYLGYLEDPSISVRKGLPAAQRLCRMLLTPALRSLPARVDRLVIVPDGVLFRLPFEALALPAPDATEPVYVNDRFALSYAPSASSLDPSATGQDVRYDKDALAFGVSKYPRRARLAGGSTPLAPSTILDDIYGRRGFAIESIPNVKDEIADLERRLPPGKVDAYQGHRATEQTLKGLDLGAYRLIHLACHAFSDDSHPLRSALLLSPEADDREDGYLQVSEMYDLRTNADLVVLSACQTGRGTIVMNEGNLGLPRVFFYMGARSVLSTLWPVNDKAGAVFMRHFYDAYFGGDGKAEALRTAKRAMGRTRFAHPYFWASYVLTGGF
jgi:CHAT domain-containing protein/tetratricopeptide (TPR) repeat protein